MKRNNLYFVAILIANLAILVALLVILAVLDNSFYNLVGIVLFGSFAVLSFGFLFEKTDYNIPFLKSLTDKLFD